MTTTTETTRPAQTTEAGTIVVTVGRDGSDHDRYGNGIYASKRYEARPRKDGRLTWRLVATRSDRTAGKRVTGPMVDRAQSWADDLGVPYVAGIVHGMPCP